MKNTATTVATPVSLPAMLPGAHLIGTLQPFSPAAFPFARIVLDYVNEQLGATPPLVSLSQLHTLTPTVTSARLYEIFYLSLGTPAFLHTYRQYMRQHIMPAFDVPLVYQKKPGVRLQFPGSKTVQFHTDEWYGHGTNIINCWLPLTDTLSTNALQVASWTDSVREVKKLEVAAMTMSEMNEHLSQFVQPIITTYGHTYFFNAQCVHGTVTNTTDATRVSLDFRLLLSGQDAGNKPVDQYYEDPQRLSTTPTSALPASPPAIATTYLYPRYGLTRHISQSQQRLVVGDYAKRYGITIVAEETEIGTMAHHPILLDLARGTGIDEVNTVVLFSVLCLPPDATHRQRILAQAAAAGITFHFANEQLVFPATDVATIERRRKELLVPVA